MLLPEKESVSMRWRESNKEFSQFAYDSNKMERKQNDYLCAEIFVLPKHHLHLPSLPSYTK